MCRKSTKTRLPIEDNIVPLSPGLCALKLSHRYHHHHRSITVGTYPCTLIRRVFTLSVPWSTELEERILGIISRLSHSEVWFCSWSNTNMAIPAAVAISPGLVSISSNRNWQPKTMSESGHDQTEACRYYLSVFASKQGKTPGWASGVKSQTLWSWTCTTRPRCRWRRWVRLCWSWAAPRSKWPFLPGPMTPAFAPSPPANDIINTNYYSDGQKQ